MLPLTRVLDLEDDPVDAGVLKAMLESHAADVTHAATLASNVGGRRALLDVTLCPIAESAQRVLFFDRAC